MSRNPNPPGWGSRGPRYHGNEPLPHEYGDYRWSESEEQYLPIAPMDPGASTTAARPDTQAPWSTAEDQQLINAMRSRPGATWEAIAELYMPGRSWIACEHRYNRFLKARFPDVARQHKHKVGVTRSG